MSYVTSSPAPLSSGTVLTLPFLLLLRYLENLVLLLFASFASSTSSRAPIFLTPCVLSQCLYVFWISCTFYFLSVLELAEFSVRPCWHSAMLA